ncbi:MAG: N-acetyl sugar amidotransferase, partial [Bacteroidia bacterium]
NQNDPDLILDTKGICNHCHAFDIAYSKLPKGEERDKELLRIMQRIKAERKNKKYDCLLGVSGGVDSSYLAYLCKKLDLHPLIIHFDNGWNSELAVQNIESLLNKLEYDLQTYVINWEEFKDIQLAYFKAGVVDLEFPTDHAILSSMFNIAKKNKIKYILSGHNIVTEGVYMPKSWVHRKLDFINFKDIHTKFGTLKRKTFPSISFFKNLFIRFLSKYEFVPLLNYTDYNKAAVKNILINELGWRDYGGKHYESIFTRFYQGYILPQKFHIDKRQFHYSCLIQSGQITREDALKEMSLPIYDASVLKTDKEYVLKKLNFSEESFQEYMCAPIHKHSDYKTDQDYWKHYFRLLKVLKPITALLKK